MKTIEKYSIGAGDRFGRQGVAQITAFRTAREHGVTAAIVWNKSNREHTLIGTRPVRPARRRREGRAVNALGRPVLRRRRPCRTRDRGPLRPVL